MQSCYRRTFQRYRLSGRAGSLNVDHASMILGQILSDQAVVRVLEMNAPQQRNFPICVERQFPRLKVGHSPKPVAVEWHGAPRMIDKLLDLSQLRREQGFGRPPLALFQLVLQC